MDISIENRIKTLEGQFMSLNQTNTIPYNVQHSFENRGFYSSNNLMVTGITQVGVSGDGYVPINGANKYSMAFASYSSFHAGSGVVEAYIEDDGTGAYQLHLIGVATYDINYVVFLNNLQNVKT